MKLLTFLILFTLFFKTSFIFALSVDQLDGQVTALEDKNYFSSSSLGSDIDAYNQNHGHKNVKKITSLNELIEIPQQENDILKIESVIKDQNMVEPVGSILLK